MQEGMYSEHLPTIGKDEQLVQFDDEHAAAARLGQQPRSAKL